MRPSVRAAAAARGRNRWRRTARRRWRAPAPPPDGARPRPRNRASRRPPAARSRRSTASCAERGRDIEHRERFGGLLDRGGRRRHHRREALEGLELDAERAVGGAGDLGFELAELGGGEAHLAGERLAVDEGRVERRRQQLLAVLRGHLDEIAEHVVVPDLQRAHAGRVGVARLQRRDHAAGFVAQRARLVERGVVACAHEAAVALEVRQLVGERGRQLGRDRGIGPPQRRVAARAISAGMLAGAPRAGSRARRRRRCRRGWRRGRAARRGRPRAAPARGRDRAPPRAAARMSARAARVGRRRTRPRRAAARSRPGR